jgi:hypothetical protein
MLDLPDDALTTKLRSEIERVWRQVLCVQDIRETDDFFELGGASVLGMKVMALLGEHLERDLPLRLLFDAPRLGDLAQVIAHEIASSAK